MNSCTFAGRVGSSAELRSTKSDQSVANFSLAVDRPKRNGEKQDPIWIKVTLWGKTAEVHTEYITKGTRITVSGSIDIREYETSSGENRAELTLNAQTVTLQGGGASDADEDAAPVRNTKTAGKTRTAF